jgi:hypothetical protein
MLLAYIHPGDLSGFDLSLLLLFIVGAPLLVFAVVIYGAAVIFRKKEFDTLDLWRDEREERNL